MKSGELAGVVLVVDFDGTLVNLAVDFEGLRRRVRALLNTTHELRPLGESLNSLDVPEELKKKAWEMIEEEEVKSAERVDQSILERNVGVLREISSRGAKIVVATHRSRRSLNPFLESTSLWEIAEEVLTRDSHPSRISQLKYVAEKYSGYCIVFLGDTVYDEEAAREAGLLFVKVGKPEEFAEKAWTAIEACRAQRTGLGSSVK